MKKCNCFRFDDNWWIQYEMSVAQDNDSFLPMLTLLYSPLIKPSDRLHGQIIFKSFNGKILMHGFVFGDGNRKVDVDIRDEIPHKYSFDDGDEQITEKKIEGLIKNVVDNLKLPPITDFERLMDDIKQILDNRYIKETYIDDGDVKVLLCGIDKDNSIQIWRGDKVFCIDPTDAVPNIFLVSISTSQEFPNIEPDNIQTADILKLGVLMNWFLVGCSKKDDIIKYTNRIFINKEVR